MQVSLINYTGIGHPDPLFAGKILAYTKNTRLQMTPDGLDAFMRKPDLEILQELAYMATTIPSSLEFVDLTFSVQGISRATAQQVTRTRSASYAMQSQRVTDMRDVTWDARGGWFDTAMQSSIDDYQQLVEGGMTLEDARDVLPIGVHCNILCKYNFRAFVDLVRARDSLRVQGPYREMVAAMKAELLKVWPWAQEFFTPKDSLAINLIEEVAKDLAAVGGEQGAMYKGLTGKLAKAADLLKKE